MKREPLPAPYVTSLYQLSKELSMENREVILLEPDIKDKFSCSSCAECCQRPWQVSVSQSYYEKWNPVFHAHPSGQFKNAMIPYAQPIPGKYAELKRKPGTHECVFLDDDRLCLIQKEHGPEALSQTCQKYPRYDGWQGAIMGRYLRTGCPDVADLIKDPVTVYFAKIQIHPEAWQQVLLNTHVLGLVQGQVWMGLTLDVAGDSRYTPSENLLRIGHILKWVHQQEFVLPEQLHGIGLQVRSDEIAFRAGYLPERGRELLLQFARVLPLLQKYLLQIHQGQAPYPVLDTKERALLSSFTHQYLFYRCLTFRVSPTSKDKGFYQYYFHLAVQLVFLQWLAFYYRYRSQEPLSHHHLARAMSQVGYRFEHAQKMHEVLNTEKMPTEVLLEALDSLLSIDFLRNRSAS